MKTVGNTDTSKTKDNVKDLVFWSPDAFKLISKASSKKEGWLKSTKAMEIKDLGCMVQVTTQQWDHVAEALSFCPGVKIEEILNTKNEVISRSLIKISSEEELSCLKRNNKIFLGGTYAGTTWREELIKKLDLEMFNPVVKDWNESCQLNEINQKENLCDIHLYVITSEMQGVYSIAEIVESSFNENKHTIFHIIPDGFDESQLKSLRAVQKIVVKHGGDVSEGPLKILVKNLKKL